MTRGTARNGTASRFRERSTKFTSPHLPYPALPDGDGGPSCSAAHRRAQGIDELLRVVLPEEELRHFVVVRGETVRDELQTEVADVQLLRACEQLIEAFDVRRGGHVLDRRDSALLQRTLR